jgi:hypothetical protein
MCKSFYRDTFFSPQGALVVLRHSEAPKKREEKFSEGYICLGAKECKLGELKAASLLHGLA